MGQIDELNDAMLVQEQQLHTEYAKHANVSSATAQTYREFRETGNRMRSIAREAAAKLEGLRNDDTIFPEGRDRLIRETLDATRSQYKKLADKQRGYIELLGKQLELAAAPRVAKDREMAAREEVRMILDGSKDKLQAMMELASGNDDRAGVVVGSYGESYLRAQGQPKPLEDHGLVRLKAVAAARESSDATARGAANAYFELDTLRKAAVLTRELAWQPLERAGVER